MRGVNGIKSILENWFDAVADGNDITRSKPDPEVFLLAAGLAMILTACQKEESLSDPGGVCTQAITVTIPQELQTRAMAADFGNGSAYAKR